MVIEPAFVDKLVNRLESYTTELLTKKTPEDNNELLSIHSKSTVDGNTTYSMRVKLATLEGQGTDSIYYDIDNKCFPVKRDELEEYLRSKIHLKSLLLSKLADTTILVTKEKYKRIKDDKIFYLKDMAINETTGKKWCIFSESNAHSLSEDSTLLVIPLDIVNNDYTLV